MKTFLAYDHFGKGAYEFKIEGGKLVKLSTIKYGTKTVIYEAFGTPKSGQNAISKEYFDKAFRTLCADTGFSDFRGFMLELKNEPVYLKRAQVTLTKSIRSLVARTNKLCQAFD